MDLDHLITSTTTDQLADGVSQKLYISKNKAKRVLDLAIPLLMGGLAKNSEDSDWAQSLSQAISKDHDGSILDDLTSTLGKDSTTEDGGKILGHILGNNTTAASKVIGNKADADAKQVNQILKMVAPVILGALGKQQRTDNLDSSTLSDLLQNVAGQNSKYSLQNSDLLSQVMDHNKNGSILDDIIRLVAKFLSRSSKKSRL